jgi:hypothetical protein
MSFSDDEDQEIVLLLGREKAVAGFRAIMRDVYGGSRVGRHYPQDFSRLHGCEPFAGAQHRQGTKQPADIELCVVVYQFAGHAGLFQLILMMPI